MTRAKRLAVSMADVAQLSGVSVATVSHVIKKSRRVSPDTELAVLQAIARSGYIVESQGVSATKTLGMAMSSISNTYFGEVVSSVERAAAAKGYSLLLADTHDEVTAELRAVSNLVARRVDAIILAPSADPTLALQQAQHHGIPVVLIDRLSSADVDQIGAENVEPTAKLVDHLAEIGHQRVAMIGGQPGLSTSEERNAGYRDGLARNSLFFDANYLVSGDSRDGEARSAILKLMALPKPPTALVVANNSMTIGALRGALELGIRIPEDLALVSFDDFEWAELFRPRLTVIAQPLHAMGKQAVDLVISRLEDPSLPVRRVVMATTFVHRESCGCPPA